ncbi:MAG: hypothetical protein KDK70_37510 [Myxococcales bacterium]|nr:hypothetical protein [Myxococcales bacterium]
MTMPTSVVCTLVAGLLLLACGDDSETTSASAGTAVGTAPPSSTGDTQATGSGDTAMAESTGCTDEPPALRIVNETGNAIEEIEMLACDMSASNAFPVPPGALPTGGELTIDLPGPGCWVVTYSGEGCFPDPPFMTEAAACEMVTWEAGLDTHVCAGG